MPLLPPAELLPVFNKVLADAADQLSKLVGFPVAVRASLEYHEAKEVFLQKVVCEAFNMSWQQIIKGGRRGSEARHMYWYLSRSLFPDKSLKELAKELRRKDHTTALYGIRQVQDLLDVCDQPTVQKIEFIEKKLRLA